MSVAFDPYYKWLAIPPAEQPPHHYRLLGVALFEADADVIESAADQRMAHVRSFQTGRHSAESQRILNELAAARHCLLDANRKAAYDDELRLILHPAEPVHGALPVVVALSQPAVAIATAEPLPFVAERPVRVVPKGSRLGSQAVAWLMLSVVVILAAAGIGPMILKAKWKRAQAAQDGQTVSEATDDGIGATGTQKPPDTNGGEGTSGGTEGSGGSPGSSQPTNAPLGRYVRIELPRLGWLTLAEVEVYVGRRNIARIGKATQISTFEGDNGKAENAIDGITHGHWLKGGLAHTQEAQGPWWELDLGEVQPVESVVVYNRTDACGERLEGFTLQVLDADRQTVVEKKDIPAPKTSARFDITVGNDGVIRLESIPQVPEDSFEANLGAERSDGQVPTAADGRRLNLGFETGDFSDWTTEGDAFGKQPVKGDLKSRHVGEYWIGGDASPIGAKGKLISVPFKVTKPYASFLIAGDRDSGASVELVRHDTNSVFFRAQGYRNDMLEPVAIDLREHVGHEMVIRIIDDGAGGRVSFDDFRFHETKPTFTPAYFASSKTGARTDVLRLIDIDREGRGGDWHFDAQHRLCGDRWRMMRLPAHVPEQYDLALTVEGSPVVGELWLILAIDGRQTVVILDGWNKTISGISLLDGRNADNNGSTHRGKVLLDGQPNRLICQVRKRAVKIVCNEATVIDWQGDAGRLGLHWGDAVAGWEGLLVGGPGDGWKIAEIGLTPFGGPGHETNGPQGSTNPPRVGDGKPPKPRVTAKEIATLQKHTMTVLRVAFYSSQVLLSGGRDGKVFAWNVNTGTFQGEVHSYGGNREVWAMAFHPKNGVLAVANRDDGGSKLLFKNINGEQLGNEVADFGRGGAVVSMAYSRDGRLLATGQDNGTIRIWDLPNSRELQAQGFGEGHSIYALAFGVLQAPDRKNRKRASYPLAAGGRDGILHTFDVQVDDKTAKSSVTPAKVVFPQGSEIYGLQFSPAGNVLGCARISGRVTLYNPGTGKSIRDLADDQQGEHTAFGIAFHPNRPWCLTAHKENVARLWNTDTGELLGELKGHTAGVTCAQFSPDGRLVATASEDLSVRLWEINDPTAPPPIKPKKR